MQTMTELERSFIGTLLTYPDKMATAMAEGVSRKFFACDAWSLMWSALENLWRAGEIESASPLTVRAEARRIAAIKGEHRSDELLAGAEQIEKAIDDAARDLPSTIRILRNAAIERGVKSAFSRVMGEFDNFADGLEPVQLLRGELDGILDANSESKKISPRAVFDSIMDGYRLAHKMRVADDGPRDLHWTPGVKMPWPKLTEIMNGLRPGLHIIAARPSVGKTAFAMNLMRFWCESGVPVLFCSLDMPASAALSRFTAEKSRVSIFKASFSPTKADLATMEKATEEIKAWPLSVVETHDVDAFRTRCMIEKQAGRLGVVVIDYLQLMHARALGREDAVEYARVSYVSDTLKRLANELNVPVVALAQLNRESTKQDRAGQLPGLADLKGSGSIEQDAFTVTILHRDASTAAKWFKGGADCENARRLIPGTLENPSYRYNFDDLDPIWWILCKAQNGPTGKLPFVVRKKYFCWMLGDYEADAIRTLTGYGATAREVSDNSPKFERVHADWRHDPIENTLRLQLALLPGGDEVAVEGAEA